MSPADLRDSAWGAPASCSTPASQVGRTRQSSRSSSRDLANALAAGPRDERGTRDPDPSRSDRDGTRLCRNESSLAPSGVCRKLKSAALSTAPTWHSAPSLLTCRSPRDRRWPPGLGPLVHRVARPFEQERQLAGRDRLRARLLRELQQRAQAATLETAADEVEPIAVAHQRADLRPVLYVLQHIEDRRGLLSTCSSLKPLRYDLLAAGRREAWFARPFAEPASKIRPLMDATSCVTRRPQTCFVAE
jgi:hypothetical protein